MPQVTVYIRKKDLEKWQAVEKKTEFIHNALNNTVAELDSRASAIFVDEGQKRPNTFKFTGEGIKLCKHGYPPVFCKFAKLGKPCK